MWLLIQKGLVDLEVLEDKQPNIEIREYNWKCWEGCCSEWDDEVWIDGEFICSMYDNFAISKVLGKLGIPHHYKWVYLDKNK